MSISSVITIIFTVAYLLVSLYLCRGLKLNVKAVTMGSLACALTMVLSLIYIPLPTGSSITCGSMLPMMILALVCDPRPAIVGGWVCGILAAFLLPGWQPVHWGQIFVEHLVCFSCLGYTGLFGGKSRIKVLCGAVFAAALKVIGHILSGVLFFSQNAWDGWGAWGYSLTYNLSSNVPESILSIALLFALPLSTLDKMLKGGHTL